MRLESKIAAGIVAVIVIIAGVWFLASSGGESKPADTGAAVTDAGGTDGTSVADASAGAEGAGPDATAGSAASPAPIGRTPSNEVTWRPRPVETVEVNEPRRLTNRTGLADPLLHSEPDASEPEADTSAGSSPEQMDDDRSIASDLDEPETTSHEATTRPSGGGRVAPRPIRVSEAPVRPLGESETVSAPALAEPRMREHTIEPGDTFSSLAVKYLGHAKHVGLILAANPDLDPRRLHVGVKVKIPARPEASATATGGAAGAASTASVASPAPRRPVDIPVAPGQPRLRRVSATEPIPAERAYTVQPGETWTALAERFLGKGADWTELYDLNKARVSNNPNLLRAGTVIELPVRAKRPDASAPKP